MKPNDKAIEAALLAAKTVLRNNEITIDSAIFAAVTAAYAAQFKSEDYAGLINWLRDSNRHCSTDGPVAADALEALLAERDALMAVNAEFSVVFKERDAAIAERDALLARLAPVDDDSRHLTTEEQKVFNSALRRSAKIKKPVDDKALVEIAADAIDAPLPSLTWEEREGAARAVIAAIRPHIEAAERERCAKELTEACELLHRLTAIIPGNDGAGEEVAKFLRAAAIRSGK